MTVWVCASLLHFHSSHAEIRRFVYGFSSDSMRVHLCVSNVVMCMRAYANLSVRRKQASEWATAEREKNRKENLTIYRCAIWLVKWVIIQPRFAHMPCAQWMPSVRRSAFRFQRTKSFLFSSSFCFFSAVSFAIYSSHKHTDFAYFACVPPKTHTACNAVNFQIVFAVDSMRRNAMLAMMAMWHRDDFNDAIKICAIWDLKSR